MYRSLSDPQFEPRFSSDISGISAWAIWRRLSTALTPYTSRLGVALRMAIPVLPASKSRVSSVWERRTPSMVVSTADYVHLCRNTQQYEWVYFFRQGRRSCNQPPGGPRDFCFVAALAPNMSRLREYAHDSERPRGQSVDESHGDRGFPRADSAHLCSCESLQVIRAG